VETYVDERLPSSQWDYLGLIRWAERKFAFNKGTKTPDGRTIEPPPEFALDEADIQGRSRRQTEEKLIAKAKAAYDRRERDIGAPAMREIERFVQHDVIDKKWKDHLRDMDHLKEGIHLRAHAQKDPKLEYKREGYNLFMDMMVAIYEEVTDLVLKVKPIRTDWVDELAARWDIASEGQGEIGGGLGVAAAEMARASERSPDAEFRPVETIKREGPKVGPNDPCPCGSGKKYKKCCMRRKRAAAR
jgi:preprotein translocase subunit SecA